MSTAASLQEFTGECLSSRRYYGRLEFAEGLWCGIELDEPTGKNNGSARGIRYFSCEQYYGIFVQLNRVEIDTSKRPSKPRPAGIPRTTSQSSLNGQPLMHRKMSVPAGMSYKPSKTAPQRKHRGGGILKKSSSEWDLLGSRNNVVDSDRGLSGARRKEMGSYSDLKSAAGSNAEEHRVEERKRKFLRPTASCMNMITITTAKKGLSPSEEGKEGGRTQSWHHSLSNWPRTSTPHQPGGGNSSTSSSSSSMSDSDRTPHSSSSSSASPVSTKVEHSPTPNLSPTSTPATAERAFVVSPDDVFTSSSVSVVRAPAPIGLTTPAAQAMENIRVAGRETVDQSSPHPDSGQVLARKYRNRQSGMATLSHPLRVANGHGRGGQVCILVCL